MVLSNKIKSLIPAYIASLIDIGLTIIQQKPEYWNGNLAASNEGNPIGKYFMLNHVSGLFVISGIWLIIIGIAGYYLPSKFSKIFLLFVLIAHSFGASTRLPFWWAMVLILFNTVVYILIDDSNKLSKTNQIN